MPNTNRTDAERARDNERANATERPASGGSGGRDDGQSAGSDGAAEKKHHQGSTQGELKTVSVNSAPLDIEFARRF